MSTYEQYKTTRLTVTAEDQAVEICVLDAHFQVVQRELGHLDVQLEPGIYQVQLRAGTTIENRLVTLRAGAHEVLSFRTSDLKFASPAPLTSTAKTHEFHEAAAYERSREVHASAGSGSTIFVFARDWTRQAPPLKYLDEYPHPARGLTLLDIHGRLIADLARDSEAMLSWEPSAACNIEVDPGVYRLQLELPSGDKINQTIVASPGWQTQVFLLQRTYGPELELHLSPENRRADLANASILLSREERFDPNRQDLRLVELARLGLGNQRQILSDDVRRMLREKFDNPMLGIFGAHLLLLNRKPDFDLLRIVVDNLRQLLGQHPDVEALAWRCEMGDPRYVFTVPPMLRGSWSLILDASVSRPDLIPDSSQAAQVAERLLSVEPWHLWVDPALGVPVDSHSYLEFFHSVELSNVEEALLIQLQALYETKRPRRGGPVAPSPRIFSPGPEAVQAVRRAHRQMRDGNFSDDVMKRLVRTVNLPRSSIERLVSDLVHMFAG